MADPKRCWCCGRPGTPYIGSQLWCQPCEVTWMPYARFLIGRYVEVWERMD